MINRRHRILCVAALALASGQAFAQKPGDLNSDGKLDTQDVSLLMQTIADSDATTPDASTLSKADLNKDGRLDVADIIMLAKTASKGATPNYTVSTTEEAPQWQVDWSYNQQRPNWTNAAKGTYENWSIIYVHIEEELQPYVTADDLMAIFVGGELRGLASPTVNMGATGNSVNTTFLLKVWGNEANDQLVDITLKYYNSQLNQIFSLSDTFTVGEVEGVGSDFTPPFTLGSAKYPVTTVTNVSDLLDLMGLTPAPGDMMGAFVGDECRGLLKAEDANMAAGVLTVYLHDANETFTLKYYQAATGRIYQIEGKAPLSSPEGDPIDSPLNSKTIVAPSGAEGGALGALGALGTLRAFGGSAGSAALTPSPQLNTQGDWEMTIRNPEDIAAWQMKVTLTEGLSIRERKVSVGDARFSSFSVVLPDGYDKNKYYVVGLRSQTGNSYFLFCIPLLKDYTDAIIDNAVGKETGWEEFCTIELGTTGKGDLAAPQRCSITSIVTSDKYAISTPLPSLSNTTVARHSCDTNADLTVDVADISAIISAMADGGATGTSASLPADANGDGSVDVADVATVIDAMAQ